MLEPAGDLVGHHLRAGVLGDVGDPALVRDAVEVDEAGDAVRLGVGELDHHAAALGVPDDRDRPAGADLVEHGDGVAQVGVPRVQRGTVAVAVAALVPADDPPAAGGEQRGEHVVGAGEVEAAVDGEQRRRIGIAPLVGGEADAAGVDAPLAVRRLGTGEGHVVVGHTATITTPPPADAGWSACATPATLRRCDRDCWARWLCRRRARHLAMAAAACSDDDDPAASETLAPIQTTTTTSTDAAADDDPAAVLRGPARRHADQDRRRLRPADPGDHGGSTASSTPTPSRPARSSSCRWRRRSSSRRCRRSRRCPVRRHCLPSRRSLRRLSAMTAFWPTADALERQDPPRHPPPPPAAARRPRVRRPRRRRLRGAGERVRGARVHGLEERWRHQLRPDRLGRRRARLPRLLGQGQDRQGRPVDVERRGRPVGAALRRVDRRQLRPRAGDQARAAVARRRRSARSTATTTTASTPTTRAGSCAPGWS